MQFISAAGCQLSLTACPGRLCSPVRFYNPFKDIITGKRNDRTLLLGYYFNSLQTLISSLWHLKYRCFMLTQLSVARTRECAIDRIMIDLDVNVEIIVCKMTHVTRSKIKILLFNYIKRKYCIYSPRSSFK